MALSVDELMDLEDELRPRLNDELPHILISLNQKDKLAEFLEMIGMSDVLSPKGYEYKPMTSGNLVIIGGGKITKNEIIAIMESLNISRTRLECCLDYADAKRFNFRKLQYSAKYSVVMVGNMGHKAQDIGKASSAISMMENEDGYPPVMRLISNNELKITKSNFKEALSRAISDGLIA